ncbi:MAG: hypothetical protein ABSH52_09965 [Terriglobia bacterium]|jgi:hypothetical protein
MKNKVSGSLTATSLAGVLERTAEGFTRLIGRSLLGGVAVSLFAFALCAESAWAQTPQINTVQFSGSAGNYTLTIKGSGFGKPTVALPFTGDVANFRIGDDAQLGHGEWGYTGDANVLAYESWSDSTIAVARFGGQPCDSVVIALWNTTSHLAGTWGGNIPCNVSPPQITSVELSGTGAALQIVVHGTGFGSAPSTLPPPGTAGDSNYFWFLDFRSHCGASSSLFEAGFDRWGAGSPDAVTLYYQSWADDQIVISGFGGAYGTGCATYVAGDPIAIVVYSSDDTSDTEAQAAWGGPAAASIALSVQDLTTGKSVVPGGTITAGDQFQVTVTAAPEFNCAGQFAVTAVGAAGAPPSVIVQVVPFIIGPFTGTNSATGGILTSNGAQGDENDWKISASCNGGSSNSFAFSQFEFLSAVP